ncbi:hypothetical protein E1A91_D10G125200v1 [Gossypium mustelinum]|uniref:Uncharacterized protein n=4 Tax=Gossypium TaxID=3633 RepID=A0A5J5PQ61_GOSBA|nr:hypothetical protein ES319_D10G120900v1 [Gossypium barbadense]TYG49874.1 hypothetical protein ES288_D10G129100v1 [Gossypium darwinii]TYH49370.1 hypothetical protein ES332_D10G131400v1 [Gossypium tomentosum]TYI60747.1 hypothetical protein E1A91_D10G125200v1 [Gossypium mustelinum]
MFMNRSEPCILEKSLEISSAKSFCHICYGVQIDITGQWKLHYMCKNKVLQRKVTLKHSIKVVSSSIYIANHITLYYVAWTIHLCSTHIWTRIYKLFLQIYENF